MKKVCFLNGHLILREHKTGVHYFHEIVTKKIVQIDKKYSVNIAFFDTNGNYKEIMETESNQWIKPYSNICKRWPRILSYVLPIEIFFGKNDVYFCDGLFPKCFYPSKRICLVHDLMVKIFPENYSWLKKAYLELFFRKLKKADLVVCVSETTKKDIMRFYGVNEKKIVVCYNGVDKLKLKSSNYEMDNKDISLKKKYLFYIGDMRKNKNLLNTVKGFLLFCASNPDAELYFYIAGKKGDDYEAVYSIVDASDYVDRVKFLGYISDGDKCELYKNCFGVVLLSLYEGFGMPIIEGMQYGKAVITSNCSSMQEIAEGAALLADPYDINSICNAISLLYSGEYKINPIKYKKCLERYTFDNVSDIINYTIEKIL